MKVVMTFRASVFHFRQSEQEDISFVVKKFGFTTIRAITPDYFFQKRHNVIFLQISTKIINYRGTIGYKFGTIKTFVWVNKKGDIRKYLLIDCNVKENLFNISYGY